MSRKIGRNEPCPCGSGKKYKRCCLKKKLSAGAEPRDDMPSIGILPILRIDQEFKDNPEKYIEHMSEYGYPLDKEKMDEYISESWGLKKVAGMSTENIIGKLKELNVHFSVDEFKKQAVDYKSSIQLAKDHYYTQDHHAKGLDDDFIALAIYELWKRILPEKLNIEKIDDEMQDGYTALEEERLEDCIEGWGRVWEMVKVIVPGHIDSISEADHYMGNTLTQHLYNWCQDLEMELYVAGVDDVSYFNKRIKYCSEFCRLFPESDERIMVNMLRAEAESYARSGDIETADKLFNDLINKYPDDVWGYVGWGDIYALKGLPDHKDHKKAEEIYQLGLEMCDDEDNVIRERLGYLKEGEQ